MSVAVLFAVTAGAVGALKLGLTAWFSLVVLVAGYFVGVSVGRRLVVVSVMAALAGFAVVATFVAGDWWAGLGPMIPAALLTGAAVGHAVHTGRELALVRADRVRRESACGSHRTCTTWSPSMSPW